MVKGDTVYYSSDDNGIWKLEEGKYECLVKEFKNGYINLQFLYKNKLYFTAVDASHVNYIYSLDINTGEETKIWSSKM